MSKDLKRQWEGSNYRMLIGNNKLSRSSCICDFLRESNDYYYLNKPWSKVWGKVSYWSIEDIFKDDKYKHDLIYLTRSLSLNMLLDDNNLGE
jgi:hypothetical protein